VLEFIEIKQKIIFKGESKMTNPKVAVVGYGTIGQRLADGVARQEQRLADGVARQEDMELVGVSDVAPTLPVRALKEKGMPYNLYCAIPDNIPLLEDAGIPVTGTLDDLLKKVDIVLDATSAGIGQKNKELYKS